MDDKRTNAQLTKVCELLEQMNEKLDTLVAAEVANMQANEMMLKAFEGAPQKRDTDAFMNQRLLGGRGGRGA